MNRNDNAHAAPAEASLDTFRASLPPGILPPADWDISPESGVGRAQWLATAQYLLRGAEIYRSESGARINFPGTPSRQGVLSDGLEGFARTFLLAAFVDVGEQSDASLRALDPFIRGLAAGTDRSSTRPSDAWEPIGHVEEPTGQSQVEAASIALSLHLTRARVWDALPASVRTDVEAWLRGALGREPSSNNWYLFSMTIASFLEGIGSADQTTATAIQTALDLAEDWYRGEGWYSDGDGEAFDHYIGWAMHLYPVLHARLRGDRALSRRYDARLAEFLRTYSRMFDRNGAPLHLGRSLTYRMATVASVVLGEVVGSTPLSHGQSRRIASANLRYFLERDALVDGVLSLGWHGPHAATIQDYSGPASPYWASKGFIGLMLPASHPFWTDQEESLPADDAVIPVAAAGLLIQSTSADGLVRVHNHGSDHIKPHEADSGAPDPLYARFAYSTRTGPTPLHLPSDNDFQVEYRGVWSARRRIHFVGAGQDWIASWHAPRFPVFAPFAGSPDAPGGPVLPSARIQSVTIARAAIEVRIHRLRFIPAGSRVRLAGWSVAADRPGDISVDTRPDGISLSVAGTAPLSSSLWAVSGWAEPGSSAISTGTAFGRWAAVPELFGRTPESLFVALASLSGEEHSSAHHPLPEVEVSGSTVTVGWADGSPATVVDLNQLPWG